VSVYPGGASRRRLTPPLAGLSGSIHRSCSFTLDSFGLPAGFDHNFLRPSLRREAISKVANVIDCDPLAGSQVGGVREFHVGLYDLGIFRQVKKDTIRLPVGPSFYQDVAAANSTNVD